jgi:UV excision repair protein RAD23
VAQAPASGQQTNLQAPPQAQAAPAPPMQPAAAAAAAGPNANPLNLFPQVCVCSPVSSTSIVPDL